MLPQVVECDTHHGFKAALNNLGFSKAKQLFPNDELMDNLNYADRIIKNFEKDEVFNLIFKLK